MPYYTKSTTHIVSQHEAAGAWAKSGADYRGAGNFLVGKREGEHQAAREWHGRAAGRGCCRSKEGELFVKPFNWPAFQAPRPKNKRKDKIKCGYRNFPHGAAVAARSLRPSVGRMSARYKACDTHEERLDITRTEFSRNYGDDGHVARVDDFNTYNYDDGSSDISDAFSQPTDDSYAARVERQNALRGNEIYLKDVIASNATSPLPMMGTSRGSISRRGSIGFNSVPIAGLNSSRSNRGSRFAEA